MKKIVQRVMRFSIFQPLWEKLFHTAKVGMNYWGGGSFLHSGELNAFKKIFSERKKEKYFLVFDIGANEGNYALALEQIINISKKGTDTSHQIHCFEPAKNTFLELQAKMAGNPNIALNNFGLSEIVSECTLYVPTDSNVLSSVYSKHIITREIANFNEEVIKLDTIDNYCTQKNIVHINFLKIDVEGFELNVLKGAKKMLENNAIEFIQFEFGECMIDARVFFRDFWNLLHEKFELYIILPSGLNHIMQYHEGLEVFHCSNILAKNKEL